MAPPEQVSAFKDLFPPACEDCWVEYAPDVLTAKVVSFIERAKEKDTQPFFVFFAPSPPHADGVPNGPATPAPRRIEFSWA